MPFDLAFAAMMYQVCKIFLCINGNVYLRKLGTTQQMRITIWVDYLKNPSSEKVFFTRSSSCTFSGNRGFRTGPPYNPSQSMAFFKAGTPRPFVTIMFGLTSRC